MSEYIIKMDEKMARKRYPKGYFAREQKNIRRSAWFIYFTFGLIGAIAAAFAVLFIRQLLIDLQAGHDALGSALPVIAVCVGLAIFSIGLIVVFVRRHGRNIEQWMKQYAERSALPVDDMRMLDRQCVEPGSYLLQIAGKKKALLENIGIGLLTRDYIVFYGRILKRSEIQAACFYEHIVVDRQADRVYRILHLGLISQRGVYIDTVVNRTGGEQLIGLLLQSKPDIQLWKEDVLTEEGFQALCAQRGA